MQIGNCVPVSGRMTKVEFSSITGKDGMDITKVRFSLGLQNTGVKKAENGMYPLSWLQVEALGKTAEIFQSMYKDGDKYVEVLGEIKVDQWEKDGEYKSKTYIKAERIKPLRLAAYGESTSSTTDDDSNQDDDITLDDDELPPF